MYTYTTPTIPCTIEGVDFSSVDFVRLAIKGQCVTLIREVPLADIEVEEQDDNTFIGRFSVALSQEETAQLRSGILSIQARVKYQGGAVQATNTVNRRLNDVIDKVVI